MQTRDYSTSELPLVMKAVIDVLQDEGFIVQNAVPELGLVMALKESQLERNFVLPSILFDEQPRWRQTEVIEASINLSSFGKSVRVRALFQRRILDNHGNAMLSNEVDDPQYYQRFLGKLDRGIYIHKSGL